MNDRVMQIAKTIWSAGDVYIGPSADNLEAFYNAVRNEALEQSAELCDEWCYMVMGQRIRALKEK